MADTASPDLSAELVRTRSLLEQEQRRNAGMAEELRYIKDNHLAVLNREKVALEQQLEAETEFIVNKLMKRLEQLKQDKQKLANEVEFEEEYLVNTLQKRLQQLNSEKVSLETKLETEQEYIVNKLQKQVEKLAREKESLAQEKSELQRQVTDLAGAVDKLNRDKIALENQMEMEEEGIVNRLQRQLEQLMTGYRLMEQKMEAAGFSSKDLGPPAIDHNTEWVYGRSPRSMDGKNMLFGSSLRRERPTSASSQSGTLAFRATSLPFADIKKATSAPIPGALG